MTTHQQLPTLATLPDLARYRDVPLHRLNYVVLRHAIPTTHTAGRVRLFDRAGQRKILAALAKIDTHPNSAPARERRASRFTPMA